MRILCLEQFLSLGGGQLSLLDLLRGFKDRGWTPFVATPGEGPFTHSARKLGIEVSTFRTAVYANGRKTLIDVTRYACESPRLISAVARILSKNQIDLVYVNAPRLLPAAAFAARFRQVPLVFHCHNRIAQPSAVVAVGESLRISRARVIACCRYVAEPMLRYVKPECVSVVYNGVGQMRLETPRLKIKLRRIGVIGRVEREKGQMDFVCAARLVLQTFPDCRFSVIGAPLFSNAEYLREVVNASRELPVDFLGWREDIASILTGLDLLVVPSASSDSAPRVILEAFAAGVPVVAFPSGGIPEIIEDEQIGFLAAAFSSEALAERICSVLKLDHTRLQLVIHRARERWQREYTVAVYQRRVSEFLIQATGDYLIRNRRRLCAAQSCITGCSECGVAKRS